MRSFVSLPVALAVLAVPGIASAATYTWVGPLPCTGTCPVGGDWTVAANWSPVGVPGATDTAILQGNSGGAGSPMVVSNISGSVGGLVVSGNTEFIISSTLSVASGTVVLTSAVLGGGVLSLGAGVTTTVGDLDLTAINAEFDNAGTVNWASGTILGDEGAIIRNSGVWNMTAGPTTFSYGAGVNAADFYNTGTINVIGSGTTNDTSGYWGFHNSGVVHFSGGGTLDWDSVSDTTNTLDDGGSVTGNGTLLFGTAGNLGDGGVAPGLTLTLNGTTTIGTGATLQFAPGAEATIGTAGATLAGPGTFLWTGGQILGNAEGNTQPALTWEQNLAVHLTGAADKDPTGAYIINNASVLWDQGVFDVGDECYFTNMGTLTASGDLSMSVGAGHGDLENHGTVVKPTGAGVFAINGTTVDNYGTINGASGSIALVSNSNGTSPSLLEAGSTLEGSIVAYDEVSLAGTSTIAAGSTFEVGNDGLGDAATLDGSGTLDGPGTVKIDGSQVYASGTSTITFAAGGTVLLAPSAAGTDTDFSMDSTAAITLAGATTWSGGTLWVGDATLVNSGEWTTTAAGQMSHATSNSLLSNTGTFTCDPGSGVVNVGVITTSSGKVVAKSGTLLFSNPPFTQTAGTTELSGGTLASEDGATPPGTYYSIDIQGGSLTGAGTLDTSVTNEGTVAPGSASAAGTLSITQTYTQSATGVLAIGLGGTQAGTGYDVLAVAGDATIAGDMDVSLLGAYVPSVGASYTVLTSGGADPVAGTFAKVNDPTGVTLGATYNTDDVVLDVSAVTIAPKDAGADAWVAPKDAGADAKVAPKDAAKPGDAGKTHLADAGKSITKSGDSGSAASSGSSGGCSSAGARTSSAGEVWLTAVGAFIALGFRRSRRRRTTPSSS